MDYNEEGDQKVSYKSNMKQTRPVKPMKKRTPRTMVIDENEKNKPVLISEAFNLKNFDLVGKVDDMRVLTKELSIKVRQLEQWVGVIYTISMAFKDSGVLRELLKSVSSLNVNENSNYLSRNNNQQESNKNSTPFSFPFPFFQNNNYESKENNQTKRETQNDSSNGINIAEILNNPVFKELINNLFSQNKK